MPTVYAKEFARADDQSENLLSWNTDGIPFVIDTSVTAIISSQRILSTGPTIPTAVNLETSEGLTTSTKLIGSMKLVLTDDAKKHHSYTIPRCVFVPKMPVNFSGVPAL